MYPAHVPFCMKFDKHPSKV